MPQDEETYAAGVLAEALQGGGRRPEPLRRNLYARGATGSNSSRSASEIARATTMRCVYNERVRLERCRVVVCVQRDAYSCAARAEERVVFPLQPERRSV